ncbi:tetratricopeptide repeat protein [Verrucomicrobiota bacterium]
MDSPSKTTGHKHLWTALLPALPFLLAIAVFSRALLNDFTYDDFLVIVNNHCITDNALPCACLSDRYFDVSGEGTYRPVITLLYHLVVRIFGPRPFGLHLVALILHACTAVLVTRLAQRLKSGSWALLPGIAFAVHPILTEPVCGIGFMEDILSTFLVVAGLLAALWSTDAPTRPRRVACGTAVTIVTLLAAAFSKESGVMLAVFAPVFILFSGDERLRVRAACLHTIALTPAVGIFLYVRFILLPGDSSSAARLGAGIVSSAANTAVIFAKYVGRLIYPFQLSIDRHTDLLSGLTDLRLWYAAGLHATMLLGAVLALRSRRLRGFTLGIFWFYAALLPTANIIPIFHPEADRYLYLPSIGFFLALAALAHCTTARRPIPARVLSVAMALLAVALSARTVTRIGDWRNNRTLWTHEMEINPDSDAAMAELAVESNAVGQYAHAEQLARAALETNEENSLARFQLARALMRNSRHRDALPFYQQLVARGTLHRHHLAQAWHEMGFIQDYTLKDTDEAARAYAAALAINPFILDAWARLGMIHATEGRTADAISVWEQALQRFPDDHALKHNIGIAKRALRAENEVVP